MKTKNTYKRRRLAKRHFTRKIQYGGDPGPVNPGALITSLYTAGQGFIQVLNTKGVLQPLISIVDDLKTIAFSPVVTTQLVNTVQSLKTNPAVAGAALDVIADGGTAIMGRPQILQLVAAGQSIYNILIKPETQYVLGTFGHIIKTKLMNGNVVSSLGTSSNNLLTNLLNDTAVNNAVNNIITKLNSVVENPTVQNTVAAVQATPAISSGPSPTTTAGATTTLAAQQAPASTGITSPPLQALTL